MATYIKAPTVINAAGHPPKRIEEYIGRVNSGTAKLSIARMKSPAGWAEPFQTPEFAEFTVVLTGALRVVTDAGTWEVRAGEAVIIDAGERVQYSSPAPGGAEYVAVCLPAFSPDTVHRED